MAKMPRPFQKWTTYDGHVGIDYPYKDNTIVPASANGIVTFSGWFSDAGGYGVSVDYGNGNVQKYKHSDKNDWRAPVGTKVSYGSHLMEIGKTGVGSTGYHLHHEVFINGVIQTGDSYWKYIDKSSNGYVGQDSTSGGNAKPTNPAELEKKEEDENMKPILLQLDTNIDGRFVLIDYTKGTYWPVRNGWQLDRIKEDDNVRFITGPQPMSVVDGLEAVGT